MFSKIENQWVFDDTVFHVILTFGIWKRYFVNGKRVSPAEFAKRQRDALATWSL